MLSEYLGAALPSTIPHIAFRAARLKPAPGFSTAQSGFSLPPAYVTGETDTTGRSLREGSVALGSVPLYKNLTRFTVAVSPVAQMEMGRGTS